MNCQTLVKVYPNPVKNNLYIDGVQLTGTDQAEIQLYNSLGQLVLKNTLNNGLTSIDIGNVNGGSYFYKIMQNNNVVLLDKSKNLKGFIELVK